MTPTKHPNTIVFDVGRVLVRWDPDRLYERLIPDPDDRQAFFDRVGLEAMNADADRYGSLEYHVTSLAERFPSDASLILPWWQQWDEMCWDDIPETAQILRAVRKAGWPAWALSNFASDTFAIAQQRFPVLTEFDGLVVSGDVKTIKPEPEIYEILEKRTGRSGAELFFIDDKAENIAAARDRGWQTHLFDDPAELAADLRRFGIET